MCVSFLFLYENNKNINIIKSSLKQSNKLFSVLISEPIAKYLILSISVDFNAMKYYKVFLFNAGTVEECGRIKTSNSP